MIGEVAQITGFSTKTLRYYEEVGLAEPATRTEAGYRLYREPEVARLKFIKQAKRIGLTLKEIKELAGLASEHSRGKVLSRLEEIMGVRLLEIERQIAELTGFRETFLHYRERLLQTDASESCGCEDGLNFCGCLEVVTGEEGRPISVDSPRRKR